jgi:hypothetical protein
VVYPISILAALLLYQGTNAGLYNLIGLAVFIWGYSEGEVRFGTSHLFWKCIANEIYRASKQSHGHYLDAVGQRVPALGRFRCGNFATLSFGH